ncbi:MAG: phosphate signaling complex protein PhoU [Acidobacteriota bacterium]
MSHLEQRLEADLEDIRARVGAMGEAVEAALGDAVQALVRRDFELAGETILGDHAINRASREIDRRCHSFVALHLPSAGHLRFVSSVLRLNLELERIGDYAVTISREAVRISAPLPELLADDVELLAQQSRAMLRQAIAAFREGNSDLARGTLPMARQSDALYRKVLSDLLQAGEKGQQELQDLLALQAALKGLERVSDQAKNLCEETIFIVTGETKAPKHFRVLFVEAANDGASLIAEALARDSFADSGEFASAGWAPATAADSRVAAFLSRRGFDLAALEPKALEPQGDELEAYHVIVDLSGDGRGHLQVPFRTVLLSWDVALDLGDLDPERAAPRLENCYRDLAHRLRELMERLRGAENL